MVQDDLLLPRSRDSDLYLRLNTKLESQGYPIMSSLVKDLSDGVRLIQLMVRAAFLACSGLFHGILIFRK